MMGRFYKQTLRQLVFFMTTLALLSSQAFAETTKLSDGLPEPSKAPELSGLSAWLNSTPLTLQQLKGKVVLIEFWTSTCPYCHAALPIVNQWYKNYQPQGLVILGIHSPKTGEEENEAVVKAAIQKNQILYPVALDNRFETWYRYDAGGWPSFYLINKEGMLVYVSHGAQHYDQIENNIRFLLSEPKETAKK